MKKKKILQGSWATNQIDIDSKPPPEKQTAAPPFNPDDRKRVLADKVILSKRLTSVEKVDIYRYLTGKEPPYIDAKGRPPTTGRDMAMAIDFLFLRKSINDTAELMNTLRKYDKRRGVKYKENTNHIKITDSAIYSAVNRGVSAILERDALQFSTDYENGYLCDLTDNDEELKQKAEDVKELYSLIDDYLKEKEPRRKHKN